MPRAPLENPLDALVGWWTFDDVLADRSGSQNHGTMNDPDFVEDVPDAVGSGKALRFDGGAGVAIADDPSLDSDVFTLVMFVFNHGQALPFARLTSRGNDSFESSLGTGGGGDQLKYFSRAEGSWNATTHEVPFEEWQHVAYVSTGTDLTIYADGEVVHGPVPLTTTPSGVLHIGDRWNNVEGVIATIDDVALFDAALPAEDIARIADAGVAAFLGNPPPPEGPPPPPAGLRAASSDGRVQLEWDAVAEASGYLVHRSDIPGGPYERLTAEPLAMPGYLDTDVENGTLYYYVVTALNAIGESRASGEAVGAPRAPADAEDALIGWWPFDESLDDESGFGHDGIFDFALFDDDVPDAIGDGTSLSLDGSGGVEIAPSFDLDSEVFTLSMFVLDRGQIA
ncbi:MAG: LamG-like jellyroll fold domain-containing protein, partial [Candidatus Binatia bacterium]